MPGTTPVYGFQYPQSTDLVADYPALGQDLAQDLETTIGVWAAYTPALGGITTGNGTLAAAYVKTGKTVFGYAKFTLGSTSAITGTITIALPSTASLLISAQGYFTDTGAADYTAGVFADVGIVGSNVYMYAINSAGTYANQVATSATVPFTWTTNDVIRCHFWYREA